MGHVNGDIRGRSIGKVSQSICWGWARVLVVDPNFSVLVDEASETENAENEPLVDDAGAVAAFSRSLGIWNNCL